MLRTRMLTCFVAAFALSGSLTACSEPPTIVAPSSAPPAVRLPPQMSPSLSGVVFENTAQGRRPISGARVYVSDLLEGPYGNYPWYETSSDTNGRFSLAALQGLSGRMVRLGARAGLGLYQLCAVHPTADGDTTADIELVAPGVPLACGSPTLSGVVFEATPEGRRPVAGAPIWYYSFGPHDSTDVYTRTDAAGRYSFGGLPLSPGVVFAGCAPVDLVKNKVPVDVHRDTVLDFDVTLSVRDCF